MMQQSDNEETRTHQASPTVRLRAMEPADIDAIYRWENDPAVWVHSAAHQPFSRQALQQFIEDSGNSDIYSSRQLRLMADNTDGNTVGCVDLFDFDPYHRRAGVGLLIDNRFRCQGYGSALLGELEQFAATHLQLHLLYSDISIDNGSSLRLFSRNGYRQCGTRPEWIWSNGQWTDAIIVQKILLK